MSRVNHFPLHLGDYVKATQGLNQGQHGAYFLLMLSAYSTRKGIPPDEVFSVTKAATREERANTTKVLDQHWRLEDDGYHNARVDETIASILDKSGKAKDSAEYRWKKGRSHPVGNDANAVRTDSEGTSERIADGNALAMLASSHKPVTNPIASATTVDERRAEASPIALSLEEARLNPSTPAGHLSAVCLANGIRATPFHPLLVDWVKDGVTIEKLKETIATARVRKPVGDIPLAYLDRILGDTSKPVDYSWKHDDTKARALCRELGIPESKRAESYPEFHARIEQALHDRARQQVA